MAIFKFDGIGFYFETSGDGRPFLFSHGLGASSDLVAELVNDLPGTRTILYDNRGHGKTRPIPPASELNFDRMAGDMAALLDYLDVPRAVIGGVSMGAGNALWFALRYPERVEALVLARPAWLDQPNPPNLAFAPVMANLLERFDLPEAISRFEQTAYCHALQRESPAAVITLCDAARRNDPKGLAACYQGIVPSTPLQSMKQLCKVKAPTLVFGCHDDAFHPIDIAHAWAAGIPGAKFVEICSYSRDAEAHIREFRRNTARFFEDCAHRPG